MQRITPLARISSGLVALTCSLLIISDLIGLAPAPADEALESRLSLSETLASQAVVAASGENLGGLRLSLLTAIRSDPSLQSAGLRDAGGQLLLASADHRRLWEPDVDEGSTPTHIRVPISRGGRSWSTLELRFEEPGPQNLVQALWQRPIIRILVFLASAGFIAFLLYMRRTLRHLDPSAVVPARVQMALDVMAEGVLLVDEQDQIVLVNSSFAERLGRTPEQLMGAAASSLGWRLRDDTIDPGNLPWVEAIRESKTTTGTQVILAGGDDREDKVFLVNGAPVLDGWGHAKGAIATFDDVTELERKTVELEKTQYEVRLQNEELRVLASTDPLTGASNRRSFMETLDCAFAAAERESSEIFCLMADIDHFKKVNDTHGHAVGDEVIRRVADAFLSAVGSQEHVCRWGGEEFCSVLLGTTREDASALIERLREKIEAPGFARVPVTVSFGMSSMSSQPRKPDELINRADAALYASKENGRNRLTCWDELPDAADA